MRAVEAARLPLQQGVTEAELIQAAQRGDEGAFETLVNRHQEAIFRLAYLLLRDDGEAQDVAQETLIRAFRALKRFDTTRPLRPWLLRITTNLAANRRRALARYMAALGRLLHVLPDAPHDEADDVQQAIRSLEPRDQEVIYLRYFLDLSVAETAQALDIAEGTVKSRLHRALERLRAELTKRETGGNR